MKNLPPEIRPREKLISQGVQALTDIELLAILLRTGTRDRPVLKMAQELLEQFGGLSGLLQQATPEELKKFNGLGGTAKRAEIISVIELAKRALKQQLNQAPIFNHPKAVEDYVQLQLGTLQREVFAILFLDTQHQLIAMKNLFFGTLNESSIYTREVAVEALEHQAHAVILAHNHPSGEVTPSSADKEVTQRLKDALALLDIQVLDHIIVGKGASLSMAAQGCL